MKYNWKDSRVTKIPKWSKTAEDMTVRRSDNVGSQSLLSRQVFTIASRFYPVNFHAFIFSSCNVYSQYILAICSISGWIRNIWILHQIVLAWFFGKDKEEDIPKGSIHTSHKLITNSLSARIQPSTRACAQWAKINSCNEAHKIPYGDTLTQNRGRATSVNIVLYHVLHQCPHHRKKMLTQSRVRS